VGNHLRVTRELWGSFVVPLWGRMSNARQSGEPVLCLSQRVLRSLGGLQREKFPPGVPPATPPPRGLKLGVFGSPERLGRGSYTFAREKCC